MKNTPFEEHVTRDLILKLLTDDETARVSNAESKRQMAAGEEYLDLEHLDRGVQRTASAGEAKMGQILPRAALSNDTWSRIGKQLRIETVLTTGPLIPVAP